MKKFLCTLLALALCLTLAAGALADIALVQVATGSNIDFISDSNLLRVRASDGYHVMKLDGTALTSEAYGSSPYYYHGYLVVRSTQSVLNDTGLIDSQGNTIVPMAYGDVKVLDENWALAYKLVTATADSYDYTIRSNQQDSYALIETVDVYSLNKGACVASLPRTNYKDADAVNGMINIEDRATGTITTYDQDFNALGTVKYSWSEDYAPAALTTYRENGQYGVKDAAGNVVMKPAFYQIYSFYGDYAIVSTGEKEGLINSKGEVVIPAEYDDVKRSYYVPYDVSEGTSDYYAAGYFAVVKDGKLGFVNAQGVVTCEPKYSKDILDLYGASAGYKDMEGKQHILAADGVDTVVDGYQSFYPLSYCSGKLFKVCDSNYNYGVIDWHGNIVLPLTYSGISVSGDGLYLLADVDYEKSEIYMINDSDLAASVAAPAAEPASVEGAVQTTDAAVDGSRANEGAAGARAAVNALLGSGQSTATEEAAQEAPAAAAAPAMSEAERNIAVKTLIDAAIAKLEEDPAANKNDAAELVNGAIALLGDTNPSVTTVLNSTLPVIEAGNGEAAKAVLDSMKLLL